MKRLVYMVGLAVVMAVAMACPLAQAQSLQIQANQFRDTVSIDAIDADVSRVIANLFSAVGGARYQLDPKVQGKVTIRLREVPPAVALQAILNRVHATYRLVDGVYFIVPIENLPRPGEVPPAFRRLVDITAQQRPIGEVIRVLARQAGVTIGIDRDIPGDLTVSILSKRKPLITTLQELAVAARLRVDITGPNEAVLRPLSAVAVDYRGVRIGSVIEDYGTCRHCRYKLMKEWRFCPICGERILVNR
jgi:type II secretory pathway component GspD/PulD (secretin)